MSLFATLLERFSIARGAATIPGRTALDEVRWVVVDCESSGLDPRADRLLSIGAVRVGAGRIALDEAFSMVLRQSQASAHDNILVHGIDGTTQLSGSAPAAVLREFDAFTATDPLAGFHTPFDQALLERAFREFSGQAWRRPWVDLAQLAPALFPALARGRTALDHWLEAFEIDHPARHDALGDAYATAQLFLVLLAAARAQRLASVKDLFDVSTAGRWLAH